MGIHYIRTSLNLKPQGQRTISQTLTSKEGVKEGIEAEEEDRDPKGAEAITIERHRPLDKNNSNHGNTEENNEWW